MTSFKGIVQVGNKRGKKLGFPTANIRLPFSIPDGIYLSYVYLKDKKYNALTFIGAAKTYGETNVLSETYILNFDEDIYGDSLEIELIKKIRENMKFDSEQGLIQQMESDKSEAIKYFSKSA